MNQSGIEVTAEASREFAKFVTGRDRAAILHIDGEAAKLERVVPGAQSKESVGESLGVLRGHIEPDLARWIALRLPESPSEFVFIQYMPDAAPLSSKMKYASSTATIHRQLGGTATFPKQVFWTEIDEISEQGWAAQIAHEEAEAPLTEEEISLKKTFDAEHNRGTRPATTGAAAPTTLGISAKVHPDAISAAQNLQTGRGVSFAIDGSETIILSSHFDVPEAAKHLDNGPRFALLKGSGDSIAFLHSAPSSASIRDRMVLASSRASFLRFLRELPLVVETELECNDDEELEEILAGAFSKPVESTSSAATAPPPSSNRFRRPKPPGRR